MIKYNGRNVDDYWLQGIKVLKLEPWMRYLNEEDPPGSIQLIMEPKIHRDGYYFSRHRKIAWFEVSGKAYLLDRVDDFKYVLSLHDHKPLSKKEYDAMRLLISNHRVPKKLSERLWLDMNWRELRDIHRESKKMRAAILDRRRVPSPQQ
jgi:hypothetical protein